MGLISALTTELGSPGLRAGLIRVALASGLVVLPTYQVAAPMCRTTDPIATDKKRVIMRFRLNER